MAYQLWDGFDHYDLAHELWPTVTGSPAYSTSYARFPAAPGCASLGVRMTNGVQKKWNLNSNQPTLIFDLAVMFEALPSSGYFGFLGLLDVGTYQCFVAVSSAGALVLLDGTGGTVLATSTPGAVSTNVYYWLDVEITVNSSTGSVSIYLNTPKGGGALVTASGINTQHSFNAYANIIAIGQLVGTGITAVRFDDFHCHDTSGSAPNSILGDGTRIYTKLPSAAGTYTNWTPNGASANWQCVDDNPPDDDTTYVSTSSTAIQDSYAVGAAGFTGTPNGVVRRSRIRRDDAGPHSFENGVLSVGVDALGSAVAVPSSYAYFDSFFADDPATSAAWTAGGADAAQIAIYEVS